MGHLYIIGRKLVFKIVRQLFVRILNHLRKLWSWSKAFFYKKFRSINFSINRNGSPEILPQTEINVYTGIFKANGKIIIDSAFTKTDHRILKLIENRPDRIIECDYPITTIHHGPWNNYYHWHIDSLPRLWALWDEKLAASNAISPSFPPTKPRMARYLSTRKCWPNYVGLRIYPVQNRCKRSEMAIPNGKLSPGQATRPLSHAELLNRDYYRGRFANKVNGTTIFNWEE